MTATSAPIRYVPALDGIRGICLIGVLLFHAPFSWMSGGFLGVSTFFTLSGYLITTLLLAEIERSGHVGLAAFWDRRMRRLGPPLWLGVVVTVVTGPLWIAEASLERLLPDAVAALFFVSNWRYMSPEYAYTRLFSDPSALQHCWSLAIEAQYYLVFPLLLAPLARRGRRWPAFGVAALLIASVVLSLWFGAADGETYRVYYGTDTRAAEILTGAVLALALRKDSRGHLHAAAPAATWIGSAALATMISCWVVTAVDSAWLYRGGFAAYAAVSAALIWAVSAGENSAARVLSQPLLRWVGKISYGAYVYHWPIFLWLDGERTGFSVAPLFVLRVTLTLTLAALSYRYVESPVRTRSLLERRSGLAVASLSSAVVVAVAAVSFGTVDLDRYRSDLSGAHKAAGQHPHTPSPRISLYGDSTALDLSGRLEFQLIARGAQLSCGSCQMGCSVVSEARVQSWDGSWVGFPAYCNEWIDQWEKDAVENEPDLAVILVGPWEVRDRLLPHDPKPRALGDPVMDDTMRSAIRRAIEVFRRHGVGVVWITFPRLRFSPPGALADSPVAAAASRPARLDRFNELLGEVAAEYPDSVRLVDFAAYLETFEGGPLDPAIRPDGVHFTRAVRPTLARWLSGEILRVGRDLVAGGAHGPRIAEDSK